MRGYVPSYEIISPASLAEALSVLANEPGTWKPFAGGTDLMVLLESGRLQHRNYINIWPFKELRGIEVTDSEVTIGALTTYTEIHSHPVLQSEFPMLCQAASETGGLAIQNRGTLGGNIINASPAADSPPALMVYDADIELTSTTGSRWRPYNGFHTGYKKMELRSDELLTRIRIPRSRVDYHHYYRKVGTRKAQAISKVCLAGLAQTDGTKLVDIRIALGSVAPIVMRCIATEEQLRGQTLDGNLLKLARTGLQHEISPIDDIRSTANYRMRVATNVLLDFLSSLSSQ